MILHMKKEDIFLKGKRPLHVTRHQDVLFELAVRMRVKRVQGQFLAGILEMGISIIAYCLFLEGHKAPYKALLLGLFVPLAYLDGQILVDK